MKSPNIIQKKVHRAVIVVASQANVGKEQVTKP